MTDASHSAEVAAIPGLRDIGNNVFADDDVASRFTIEEHSAAIDVNRSNDTYQVPLFAPSR
ncbi:hypothetical protein [Herbiconiux daphne]|uniref:Uncharacterized protein n=1 Tax=Herbiconiux daphne TaxID=2970914 RepID=A0ABT2H8R6_9MICO|nr:hypothetical protein [Herbiconiux daphne]MCS5736318.1 hypothetical protein [Herbiconiux daphne]